MVWLQVAAIVLHVRAVRGAPGLRGEARVLAEPGGNLAAGPSPGLLVLLSDRLDPTRPLLPAVYIFLLFNNAGALHEHTNCVVSP